MKQKVKAIKNWLEKNNQFLMVSFLVFGFFFDNLTLTRIDRIYDNFIVLAHILIVLFFTSVLAFLDLKNNSRLNNKNSVRSVANFFISFSLGGLFSAFAVFYLRSGQAWEYLPFVFLLLIFMIASEIFKHWLGEVSIVLLLLFLAIQAYLAFLVPMIFNKIDQKFVILSGMISVFLILLYLLFWKKVLKIKFNFWKYFIKTFLVILVFQVFYFFNLIPPVPLSAKFLTPAYNVEKNNSQDKYFITYPKLDFVSEVKSQINGPILFYERGDRIYFFSSIFAPKKMTAKIEHRWYRKENGVYVEKSRIPIQIVGGRGDGFRGYSFKQSLGEGKWRVDVTTFDGKVIGRKSFFLKEINQDSDGLEIKKVIKLI